MSLCISWDPVLAELEHYIDANKHHEFAIDPSAHLPHSFHVTSHRHTESFDYVSILRALDRVTDAFRSGVDVLPVWQRVLPLLMRLFYYPQWIFQQYSAFAMMHVFAVTSPASVQEMITHRFTELDIEHNFLELLLRGISSKKREVRDAVAQVLLLSISLSPSLTHTLSLR